MIYKYAFGLLNLWKDWNLGIINELIVCINKFWHDWFSYEDELLFTKFVTLVFYLIYYFSDDLEYQIITLKVYSWLLDFNISIIRSIHDLELVIHLVLFDFEVMLFHVRWFILDLIKLWFEVFFWTGYYFEIRCLHVHEAYNIIIPKDCFQDFFCSRLDTAIMRI